MGECTTITIVHFNDVYNIEPRSQEPVGGAARFTTAVRQLADRDPLVLFSGDALNPALMSTITDGHQMIPVLNAIGVHCALYGNHDFDHGVDNLVEVVKKTKFPWLLSNVVDMMTGENLGNGLETHTITHHGKKLGIIGLIEEEWIATLSTIDPEDLDYEDYVTEGRRLARELKEQGADYIIALTHMRWPNDTRLAENVEEIDLILGGHDHDFGVRQINGKYVIKSGTDFRQFALLTLTFHPDGHVHVQVEERSVDSSTPEDEEVKGIVDEYSKLIMGEKMDTIIGQIRVDLDGQFKSIRCKETNLGNFVTDIMLKATNADVAFLNSGTFRSDRIHPAGDFRLRDLMAILPMHNACIVIAVSGSQLMAALENGVSEYPALEGRFPQISGTGFNFDPRKAPGERIVPGSVTVQGEPVGAEKTYRMSTISYLANGKDGYECLMGSPVLVNEDDGPELATIIQNHFQSVKILSGICKTMYPHRQSIIPLARRKALSQQASMVEGDSASSGVQDQVDAAFQKMSAKAKSRQLWKKARYALTFARHRNIEEAETKDLDSALAPCVQDRMKNIGDA